MFFLFRIRFANCWVKLVSGKGSDWYSGWVFSGLLRNAYNRGARIPIDLAIRALWEEGLAPQTWAWRVEFACWWEQMFGCWNEGWVHSASIIESDFDSVLPHVKLLADLT